jgi:cholesterol oxidase
MSFIDPTDYDVIVIGSGFGGSVAAYRLADAGRKVLVLERGRPWPPGSFPRTPRRAPTFFWDPPKRFGMFDVWSFSGINAVAASGLGGGSLIYANVLARKPKETFVYEDGTDWPVRYADLEPHYQAVEGVLQPQPYPYPETPKTEAISAAASALGKQWESSPLAVAFAVPGEQPTRGAPLPNDGPNLYGLPRCTCRLCGECDIGCNFGAKQTLDHTYLSLAHDKGADLRTLCEVTSIAPDDGGYAVTYRYHWEGADEESRRFAGPDRESVTVHAGKVIVAAGTMGTARLLLRNRPNLPGLGGLLGHSFSSNGDLLTAALDTGETLDMATGPVITGTIVWRDKDAPHGRMFQVQDAGAPVLAEWLFHSRDVPRNLLRWTPILKLWLLSKLRGDRDTNIGGELAGLFGDGRFSSRSLPLLSMGRDMPGGRFYLDGDDLELSWTEDDSKPLFDDMKEACRSIAEQLGGTFRDLPWGHLITVHALGGCAMGANPATGVVDEWGECFGHPGLYVADGSVLPGPVGPNPSLTIAALSDRFACHMAGITP